MEYNERACFERKQDFQVRALISNLNSGRMTCDVELSASDIEKFTPTLVLKTFPLKVVFQENKDGFIEPLSCKKFVKFITDFVQNKICVNLAKFGIGAVTFNDLSEHHKYTLECMGINGIILDSENTPSELKDVYLLSLAD